MHNTMFTTVRTLFLLLVAVSFTAWGQKTVVFASSASAGSEAKAVIAPEGFDLLKLEKNESLDTLCERDHLCEAIFMKVNRMDRRHIAAGRTVLLPVDTEKASEYVPVPQQLPDNRGEREVRVYLDKQYFGAYENGALLFWGPVSSGTRSHPTWPGEFVVNYKQRHKRSIKYNNAPMPYSINYDGPYFIHQQSLPGHPASHGCVRLLESDARRLFGWIRTGDPVTVL